MSPPNDPPGVLLPVIFRAALTVGLATVVLGSGTIPSAARAQDAETETEEEYDPALEERKIDEGVEESPPPEPGVLDAFKKSLTVGVGMRTGLDLIVAGDQVGPVELSLDDGLIDQIQIRPYMSGALTPHVSFFIQFEIGTPAGLGTFAILDAIAQIKFIDEIQLWVGQHISANDRNNINGPFFGNTWNFAISVPSYPFDTGARDRGATLWGILADGILKYHLSLVDLQPGQAVKNSRFGARVVLNLLEPENYYYNSGTYWGGQDTLAIGAVYQHQTGVDIDDGMGGLLTDTSFDGFSFDLFFEKVTSAGTFTVEAGYWNFENVGTNYTVNQGTVDIGRGVSGPSPGSAYMGVLSWLTPGEIGPGKLQINGRLQYGDYDAQTLLTIDGGLAYVVDGFNHKYALNYRHENVDPVGMPDFSADSIQFGVQYQLSN